MPLPPASTAEPSTPCADGSASQLPPALVLAYRNAWYEVLLPAPDQPPAAPCTLQVDVHSPALQRTMLQCGASQACLLTACNPQGELLSPMDNERRMHRLRAALQQDGWTWAPALGRDPLSQWPGEDSLLVWHMDSAQSRAWGQRWEQNAVLTMGRDAVPRLLLLR
ncbi:MAG: DUF3293 domain-containing protein [Comamonas sp.]